MSRLLVLAVVLLASQLSWATTSSEDLLNERVRLETKFEELCGEDFSFFQRSSQQTVLFLKGQRFDHGDDPKRERLVKLLGEKFFALAKRAAEADEGALAFDLLHEAQFFHHEKAIKIVGRESREPRVKLASATHAMLRWRAKRYYLVTTDHFQIVTRDKQPGVELANRLENLYTVWSQLFFTHWATAKRVTHCIEKGTSLEPRSNNRKRYKVVLFPDRTGYIEFLGPRQPRIEISLGFYDIESRTSFFFAGDVATHATQLHEVTHQLFQERTKAKRRNSFATNFWAIEGVAMYLESLHVAQPVAIVGGFYANRLQFARFRRLQEGFYIPLVELAAIGRNRLQRDQRIGRIYSQSAGLSHFLLESDNGRYRQAFLNVLQDIYADKADAESLTRETGVSFEELDSQYVEYLQLKSADFANAWVPDDALTSLCLGDTVVDDPAFANFGKQSNLNWLDLARTGATDVGLTWLEETQALRQVSLDGTAVTDATVKLLSRNTNLEELDLSNTQITNRAISDIAKFDSLKILWLSNTDVDDKILPLLEQLKHLEFLALDGTSVTPAARKMFHERVPNLTLEQ